MAFMFTTWCVAVHAAIAVEINKISQPNELEDSTRRETRKHFPFELEKQGKMLEFEFIARKWGKMNRKNS